MRSFALVGTRFGAYEISALIGVGGMGEVYRARDTNLRRDVAIKVLPDFFAGDAERLARFRREAETLASLNHQNIAHVYGLEVAEATTALVMELVEGPTLAERIAQGAIPLGEALPIALQIADALEAAHERAIVHRDLKPANIKLRSDGSVKVLDFGIAKVLQPILAANAQTVAMNTPSMTQIGTVLGTPAYMSPEQARGQTVDKRTDVWAFGCVLYEMLAGQPAFEGEDPATTIACVLERDVQMSALPASVPPSVRQTLRACLQKDAKKRFRDFGDVKLALDGAFETLVENPPVHRLWRQRISLAAAFVAGIAVLALAAWRVWPAPELRAVTRFSVPVEVTTERFVSISRDGSRVAYRSGAGRFIYVRNLDEFDARRIPGTAGAEIDRAPCFSPDGEWLAFFSVGEQLKKVSLSGGAALVVAQGFRAADVCHWGEDGYLYFTTSSGVMRAHETETSGPAELVIAPNAERNEASFQSPQLLPGGARLLFSVYDTEGSGTARVDVLDLGTRERKTVLKGVGVATYVPARRDSTRGYLVYGTGGALFAAPFDPAHLEAGTAQLVASEVLGLGAFSSGVVSESGTLAYLSGRTNDSLDAGATLIAMNRDGKQRVIEDRPQMYGEVSISPDGTRAVLTIQDSQTSGSIRLWTYEFNGDRRIPLTFEGSSYGAVWTPDSRRVVYRYGSAGNAGGVSELRSVPVDRSDLPTTIKGPANWSRGISFPTSLSADGKTLLVANDEVGAASDVLAFELDSGLDPKSISPPRDFVVTRYREHNAVFSPDGHFVAYTSNQSGTDEVYVLPFPGPGRELPVSRGGGALPRWSSKGRELLYVSGSNLMRVEVETTPVLQASTPRVLFPIPPLASYGAYPYDVSPDGTRFLMLKAGKRSQQIDLRVVVNWIDELERTARTAR